MKFKFMERNSFEARLAEASRIRQRYPDRLPIIVEKMPGSDIAELGRCKYLVPTEISFAQFVCVLLRRLALPPGKAVFWFVGSSMIPSSATAMAKLYNEHVNTDGYLYIAYSGENSFGTNY